MSYTFFNETSWGSLCRANAEWIVESFPEYGEDFANFGVVRFSDATATAANGSTLLAGSGRSVDMVAANITNGTNGESYVVARASASDSRVEIVYI